MSSMNPITKKRIGKNKWIVSRSDEVEFSLFQTLKDAQIYGGSCAGYGLHRDAGYGYTENDDGGRTTYFGRIASLSGSELDEMNRQDVESRIQGVQERVDYLQTRDPLRSWTGREDGYWLDDDSELWFKCENGHMHRVYGVSNKVVYQ